MKSITKFQEVRRRCIEGWVDERREENVLAKSCWDPIKRWRIRYGEQRNHSCHHTACACNTKLQFSTFTTSAILWTIFRKRPMCLRTAEWGAISLVLKGMIDIPCCATPCRATPCRATPCRATLCRVMLMCSTAGSKSMPSKKITGFFGNFFQHWGWSSQLP